MRYLSKYLKINTDVGIDGFSFKIAQQYIFSKDVVRDSKLPIDVSS